MSGNKSRRLMKLTMDVQNKSGHMVFFQAGDENNPFVVDGTGHTVSLASKGDRAPVIIYVGHSKNARFRRDA